MVFSEIFDVGWRRWIDAHRDFETRTSLKTSNDLLLGRRHSIDDWYFSGVMDEPSLYNRALSTNEIQAIYNAAIPGRMSTADTDPLTTGSTSQHPKHHAPIAPAISNHPILALTASKRSRLTGRESVNRVEPWRPLVA